MDRFLLQFPIPSEGPDPVTNGVAIDVPDLTLSPPPTAAKIPTPGATNPAYLHKISDLLFLKNLHKPDI